MRETIARNYEKTEDALLVEKYIFEIKLESGYSDVWALMIEDYTKANKDRLLEIAKQRQIEDTKGTVKE